MATVVSYALPLYFPNTIFVESGASFIWCEETNEPILEVPADGLICCINQNTSGCLNQSAIEMMKVVAKTEFKCPYLPPNNCYYKSPVYYDLPKHYALQVIAEMEAEPRVPQLLFACYSKESTVIGRVNVSVNSS